MIFSRLRQSLSRYLKGTHRVGGQLKFFERRPLNPTCVFKNTRERRRKKRNSLFPHSSEHSRISINSIGHLNKARRTLALRQKEQQYNKIASEKRSSGRVWGGGVVGLVLRVHVPCASEFEKCHSKKTTTTKKKRWRLIFIKSGPRIGSPRNSCTKAKSRFNFTADRASENEKVL